MLRLWHICEARQQNRSLQIKMLEDKELWVVHVLDASCQHLTCLRSLVRFHRTKNLWTPAQKIRFAEFLDLLYRRNLKKNHFYPSVKLARVFFSINPCKRPACSMRAEHRCTCMLSLWSGFENNLLKHINFSNEIKTFIENWKLQTDGSRSLKAEELLFNSENRWKF